MQRGVVGQCQKMQASYTMAVEDLRLIRNKPCSQRAQANVMDLFRYTSWMACSSLTPRAIGT